MFANTANPANTANTDNAVAIIDVLKYKNPHARDARIAFDPIPHKYTIDGNTDPALAFTSVTTWNHAHFEQFDADAIITKMMAAKSWATNQKYRGQTREQIKAGWDMNRDQAAEAGTAMHAEIEMFYNYGALDAAAALDAPYTMPDTPELRYFSNFNRTFGKTLRPYRTEWTVFHEEARLSGSIDMVFENLDPCTGEPTGTLSIYDWKRCKEIGRSSAFNKWAITPGIEHVPDTNYWHYCLQLNVYKYILQEKYGKTVTELYLVCLHPDNANHDYQRIKVADLQADVAGIIQARIQSFSNAAAGEVGVWNRTLDENR
jgi:hypothetical protein